MLVEDSIVLDLGRSRSWALNLEFSIRSSRAGVLDLEFWSSGVVLYPLDGSLGPFLNLALLWEPRSRSILVTGLLLFPFLCGSLLGTLEVGDTWVFLLNE